MVCWTMKKHNKIFYECPRPNFFQPSKYFFKECKNMIVESFTIQRTLQNWISHKNDSFAKDEIT